jgi:hypothetical protein
VGEIGDLAAKYRQADVVVVPLRSARGAKVKWSKPSKRAARWSPRPWRPGSRGIEPTPFKASGSGPPSAAGRPRRTDPLPGSDDPDGGLVHSVPKIGVVRLGGVLTVASFRLYRSSPSTQFRHELWHLSKIRTECDGIFCWRYRHHLRAAVWRLAARPVHRAVRLIAGPVPVEAGPRGCLPPSNSGRWGA